MRIVKARPEDAGDLSNVARAAKGHWGYPESWLRQWDDVLTLTPGYVRSHATYRAISGGRTVGLFALVLRDHEAILDHLWVLPSEMGKGSGRALFECAENLARTAGAAVMKVESDPHAEEFYVRMGAARCGQVPAPMDGQERYLPLMEKAL